MGQGYDGYWADIGIGEDAIIDKNARIGRNVHIRHQIDRPTAKRTTGWPGLVVIPKSAALADGTVI